MECFCLIEAGKTQAAFLQSIIMYVTGTKGLDTYEM